MKTVVTIFLLFLVASARADRPPVYVFLGNGQPPKVRMQKKQLVVKAEAGAYLDAIRLLADHARMMNYNGVVSVVAHRIAKANSDEAHWEARGELVIFRNPEVLDNKWTLVVP